MVDIYLRSGEALPSDVRLHTAHAPDAAPPATTRERRQRATQFTQLARTVVADPPTGNRRRRILCNS